TAISDMLGEGTIPFLRSVYGYTTYIQGAEHWITAAYPFYMQKVDYLGAPPGPIVPYGDPAMELKTEIWDPGYFLDVLIEGIGVRLASIAAIDPVFRSTGYDRTNLRHIYGGLKTFIENWEKSFLQTTVDGPLDPTFHFIYNPYDQSPNAIPMGFIDPVSGVAAFAPRWNEGFDLLYSSP